MRARNIKPSFFKNEELGECKPLSRVLFVGLWCLADKEGYVEYRLKQIKAEILPYESGNIENFLEELSERGLITIWTINGSGKRAIIEIPNFKKHQSPHKNEKESEIKPLFNNPEITGKLTKLHNSITKFQSLLSFEESCLLNPEDSPEPENLDTGQPVIIIPLIKRDKEFSVYEKDIKEWSDTFPGIDVLACVKYIKTWNIDNPSRRKTLKGIRQHISSWLAREQNKGPNSSYYIPQSAQNTAVNKKEFPLPERMSCIDCQFFEMKCKTKVTPDNVFCKVAVTESYFAEIGQ